MTDLLESRRFEAVTGSHFIDSGADGTVYRLNSDLVAKFPLRSDQWGAENLHNRGSLRDRATREYEMTRSLYRSGISVPRPEGVFNLNVCRNEVCFLEVPAFVMEYIEGIKLSDCWGANDVRARQLRDEEIMKAESLGFLSGDWLTAKNSIYCPREDKIVLLDFALWRRE
jgi:tRNA A-37 threonylcarbamoyl transferase component Bud32